MRVAGHDLAKDPDRVRRHRRYRQFTAVDNLLTGEENLLLMAGLRHLGREAAAGDRAAGAVRPGRRGPARLDLPGWDARASTWR